MSLRTPWQEAIDQRRRWRDEDSAAGRGGVHDRRADQVELWHADLVGEAERYFERCRGSDDGDPREALVRLIAVAGAAIDALGTVA